MLKLRTGQQVDCKTLLSGHLNFLNIFGNGIFLDSKQLLTDLSLQPPEYEGTLFLTTPPLLAPVSWAHRFQNQSDAILDRANHPATGYVLLRWSFFKTSLHVHSRRCLSEPGCSLRASKPTDRSPCNTQESRGEGMGGLSSTSQVGCPESVDKVLSRTATSEGPPLLGLPPTGVPGLSPSLLVKLALPCSPSPPSAPVSI